MLLEKYLVLLLGGNDKGVVVWFKWINMLFVVIVLVLIIIVMVYYGLIVLDIYVFEFWFVVCSL